MKKTNNISLGKCVFCIEEDAVVKLQQYIKTLEDHYLKEEGGQEIMNDIEVRLAELFTGYQKTNNREYIVMDDVQNAIKIMGTPNDIIDEEVKEEPKKSKTRKLYRDVDQRIIAGVAAGLAQWLDIPITVIRILFLLLFFLGGGSVLLYIICWIIIPPATSSTQKLEMQGESVNISNIAKKSIENIQKTANNDTLINIGNVMVKIIFSVILMLASIIAIAITVVSVVNISLSDSFFNLFTIQNASTLVIIMADVALYLVAIIPIALLIWVCCAILFMNWKMQTIVPICMFTVWILAITFFIIIMVQNNSSWLPCINF